MSNKSELQRALSACKKALAATAVLSGVINVVTLTGSVYMLTVYDRVLVSHSIPTLVGVTLLALAMFAFQGVLEVLRARLMARIGTAVEESAVMRVRDLIQKLVLIMPGGRDSLAPLRDLDQIRVFLASNGPTAFFDLPWIPLYLGIAFAFHPIIGTTVLAGASLLIALTILTEVLSRGPSSATQKLLSRRTGLAEVGRRNAEVIAAMGMGPHMARRFAEVEADYIVAHLRASDVAGVLSAVSRIARTALQSIVLGIGAYLVIMQEASGGVMIAASIMTSKALGPVEQAIANWRQFLAAREGWGRLNQLLSRLPAEPNPLPLAAPKSRLVAEAITLAAPGQQRLVLRDVTFGLEAGSALGVIGPSASGKSSLARALVGVWQPARGTVRLDGASITQWAPDQLGRHIGYLPQDVELIDGTLAENIGRFDPHAEAGDVIAAARAAGVHDMIVNLPEGYDTRIGEGGTSLSAGQCQRIGLARALYGNPFLIVLDEPNSNLDSEGEQALITAIEGARDRGAIVIVIAHRSAVLAAVDKVLMLKDGAAQAFGPRDEVLAQMLRKISDGQVAGPPQPQVIPAKPMPRFPRFGDSRT